MQIVHFNLFFFFFIIQRGWVDGQKTIGSGLKSINCYLFREKDEIMSGGEGTKLNTKQKRVKKRRPHFTR